MNGSQPTIHAFDWPRLLHGDVPWVFLIEVVVRVLVLFTILVVATRLMGRRLTSGLTLAELVALVALAAGIGPAVQDPGQGLLPPLLIAACVVLFQRSLTRAVIHARKVEGLLQGSPALLVSNGRVLLDELKSSDLSRERLFGAIRNEGCRHLGQLERVFLEPNGSFSLVRREPAVPGLSVLPEWDTALLAKQATVAERACAGCGVLVDAAGLHKPCLACGGRVFTPALAP